MLSNILKNFWICLNILGNNCATFFNLIFKLFSLHILFIGQQQSLIFAITFVCNICTREDEIQQDSTSSILDTADGGKVNVQDQEKDAAKETGHTNSNAKVTGIGVVVEDTEQTLAANVDVAFVDDAAKHHHGENLQRQHVGWFVI